MAAKTHVVLRGSKRGKDLDSVPVGKVDPKERIVVTIGLTGPKLPTPDEYVNQTLTPEELTEKFGASKADADKVANSLKKYGIQTVSVSLATRSMTVSGTAKAMEAAFKPGMVVMRSARDGDFRGRQGTLQIPQELQGVITGVFGLDQRRMADRKAGIGAAAAMGAGLAPLAPADLEQRYNFPPGMAAGQSIVIAEFGGGYFPEDIAAYCKKFLRPVPNVQALSVDAPAYTLQQILALPPRDRKEALDNSGEVMMDVEIIAGLCSGASIFVYFSSFDQRGWVDLLNKVITVRPVALSCSWGLAEDSSEWSANAVSAINDRLNVARLLGITVCASSGDDGSGDEMTDGGAHIDFPSSSPNTLGVGGTMLTKSGSKINEVAWWESPGQRSGGGGASGGGVSTVFPRPAWQKVNIKSLNPRSIDGRVAPDIAALSGEPYYDLIFVGKDAPNGGTSASAPLWASLIARINANLPTDKQQRFLTPLLYQESGASTVGSICTRDITVGDNTSTPEPAKGYRAGPGYDAVTGWGVPDGIKLLNVLAAI
jgi:kumamolisin